MSDPESFLRAVTIGNANWSMRRYRVSGDPAYLGEAIAELRRNGVEPPQHWIDARAKARPLRRRGAPAKADQLARL
jgi:hypothetical protein